LAEQRLRWTEFGEHVPLAVDTNVRPEVDVEGPEGIQYFRREVAEF